jgi:hypothetical protein
MVLGEKEQKLSKNQSAIIITGPSQQPELPPELEPFVRELVDVHRKYNTFDYAAREQTRAVGKRINKFHGYEGMVTVCDTLRFVISGRAARELEYVWDRIGRWRN